MRYKKDIKYLTKKESTSLAVLLASLPRRFFTLKSSLIPSINLAIFLVAAAAISYEILGASVLVNLLGASIYYFSLTIGIFLAALGVGAWLSSKIEKNLVEKLIFIEIILAFLGGSLAVLIYGSYIAVFELLRKLTFYNVTGFIMGLAGAQLIFSFLAFFLIFIVGVLIGFELPLFSRISAQNTALKNALSKVFFWDYAGSLIASVLLPIVFFVFLGLIKTSFLMGVVNVIAAFMLILILRSEKERIRPILFYGLVFVLFINILGFFISNRLELFFEKKQYGDREILYHYNSPYQRFSFVQAEDGKISLYINGQRQFESGEWEILYHETLVHPAMNLAKNRQNVLVLGGGDGLALREILKYNDVLQVTLVDIDPAIVETTSELDFMRNLNERAFDDPRVKVIIDDAFKFLEQQKRRQNSNVYDLIFIDFPDPTDDSLARLYSKEFYLMLKTVVAPGTLVTIQSSGYMEPIQKTIILTLESVGFKTLAFQPPYFSFLDQNFGFTLASLGDLSIQEIQNASLKVPTVILKNYPLSQLFAASQSPNIPPFSQSNIKVNSIFRPSLIQFQITTFAEHYLESQPKEKILSQIKLPEEEIIRQFQKNYF